MSKFQIKYRFKITDKIQPSDLEYFHWKVTDAGELVIGLYPYFDVEEDHKGKFLKTETLTTCPFAALATEITSCIIDDDIAPVNLTNWFVNLYNLTTLINFSKIDVSNITTLDNLFNGCIKLANLGDINEWDVSNVTSMSKMFYNCYTLPSISVLDDWKTKVSQVTNISYMLSGCSELANLEGIEEWVFDFENIEGLFQNCSKLEEIDLSDWASSKEITSIAHLFENCSAAASIAGLDGFIVEDKLTDISYAFAGCQTDAVNNVVADWTATNVINAAGAFKNLDLGLTTASDTILVLTAWKLDKVQNVNELFSTCSLLKEIRVSNNWNADNSADLSSSEDVFSGDELLTNTIYSIAYNAAMTGTTMLNYTTGYLSNNPNVGVIYATTHECTETNPDTGLEETFNEIVLSSVAIADTYKTWDDLHNQLVPANTPYPFRTYSAAAFAKNSKDTRRIVVLDDIYPSINMSYWFANDATSHLNFTNNWPDAIDNTSLAYIHTDYVNNMSSLFSGMYKEIFNIMNWDTSKVKDMSSMFAGVHATTVMMPTGNTNYEDVESLKLLFSEAKMVNSPTFDVVFDKANLNGESLFDGYIGPIHDVKLRFMETTNLSNCFHNAVLQGRNIVTMIGDIFIDIGSSTEHGLINWSHAFEGLKMYDTTQPDTYADASGGYEINLIWSTSYPLSTPSDLSYAFKNSLVRKVKVSTVNLLWDTDEYTLTDPVFEEGWMLDGYLPDHVSFSDYTMYVQAY